MGTERVVKLLRSHRVRIARALVRQTRALAPRYEQVDGAAQERSFVALLLAIEVLVETGEDRAVLDQVGHLAEMRSTMGFRVDDFVLAGLAFLPVFRRFVIEHSTNSDEGIDDYEALEAIALPFIGRAATIFLDAAEETTLPTARPKAAMASSGEKLSRLRIERVTGSDEDEETYRNHPLFRSSG